MKTDTKKYSLIETDFKISFGIKLFRIKAEATFETKFGTVKSGELGGYIEKEQNLDQSGNAWVYGNAQVTGDARVSGDAQVYGNAWIELNTHLLWISKIGSENRTVTFFKTKAGVGVACGCFYGTLKEFEKKVKKTHGNNEHAKAYKLAIQLAKLKIKTERG